MNEQAHGAGPLAGLEVVERAGRLSVSACGFLLASLGARVLRVETPDDEAAVAGASPALHRLLIKGKTRVRADGFQWPEAASKARVVLLSAQASDPLLGMLRAARPDEGLVVCCLSAQGLGYPDLPEHATDALVQALGGLMAVTGVPDGEPEYARVPVGELSAAVIATTAIVASLRTRQSRLIDLSLVEIVADQLRSHVSLLQTGRTRGFRSGCAHPLCCPWNAYPASDGWLLICSATDAHWAGIARAIEAPDLAQDPRYATRAARLDNRDAVDARIADFTRTRPVAELLQRIGASEVPVGPVVPTRAVQEDPVLRASGSVEGSGAAAVVRMPLRIRAVGADVAGEGAGAAPRTSTPPPGSQMQGTQPAQPPLAGIRVVELTVYAAGPLAGFALASLGAEVTKIESPTGEECRTWQPQFDGVSGYFANYNAGKRSMRLDLRGEAGREQLRALLASADVFLHNLRPGAVERLGFGVEAVARINPRIVYCAISGYGSDGPPLPALDTVIQGHGGLASAVGDGSVPLRIGYSIADQLAGHFAAAGIVSALHAVARTGQARHVDMAMVDAIAWLTHLGWAGPDALPPACRIRARDGFVMAAAAQLSAESPLDRAALVDALASAGIASAPVLDADEVLLQPSLVARGSLKQVTAPMGQCAIDVFAAPFGMQVVVPGRMARLGEHDTTT